MSERQKRKLAQREANRLKKRMIEKVLALKSNHYAPSLNCLVEGWLELESDPGTFSLLIEDYGCFGAQVDEIYDLDQKFEGPVFGFIFLFKWLNNQHQSDRSRNYQKQSNNNNNSTSLSPSKPSSSSSSDQITEVVSSAQNGSSIDDSGGCDGSGQQWPRFVQDEEKINDMFFARQMIVNSCATHALISVLLNCAHHKLNLGPTLSKLKEHTKLMSPECRGYAIGNLPEIAKAHNSHASFSSLYNRNRLPSHLSAGMSYMISGNQRTNLQQQKKHEAYHFVSYVPIKNRLYELDGLKEYPIDHGPIDPKKDWTEKFKEVIKKRLAIKSGDDPTVSNDIRYNLMAVVPDKRLCLKSKLRILKGQRELVANSMEQMTKPSTTKPPSIDVDIPNPPYSPLSNATETASESGSPPHSSAYYEADGYQSVDEDLRTDKYFFIKFDSASDASHSKEENTEPAHKNCIIKIDPTPINPLNLKKDPVKTKSSEEESSESPPKNLKASSPELPTADTKYTSGDPPPLSPEAKKENGLAINNGSGDDQPLHEHSAHNNEKYNLSGKPPFEFNILDELQHVHSDKSTLRDLTSLSHRLEVEIKSVEATLKDEIEKRRKYKVDNSRRTHNYEPFIMTFLSLLASHGKLADLIERDLGITSEETSGQPPPAVTVKSPVKEAPKTVVKNVAKPKYRYVSTGRPVGRPRKNPLVPPPNNSNKTTNA